MRSAAIVLAYHRVSAPARDPQRLCVHPTRFADHIGYLVRRADIVPLEGIRRAGRRLRVAVTFDDGYADNLSEAAPVLAAYDAPATVFVTAGMVGAEREFWWDRLENLIFSAEERDYLDLPLAGGRLWVDIRTEGGRERAYWALHARLRRSSPDEIDQALTRLEERLGASGKLRGSYRVLNGHELRLLASSRVEVGSHTLSHPYLASLPARAQHEEIVSSRARLETLAGRPVRSFSYPYGERGAFDASTVRAVKSAGYDRACANEPGRVTRRTDPYRIPRYLVRDWTAGELAQRIETWIGNDP